MTLEFPKNTVTMSSDDPLHFLSWTPEDKHFPFFHLPALVQEKILKQYVPVFTKINTLSQIPQFSKLLNCRSSWLNVSDEFAQLIPILRSLQEGVYVPNDDLPHHGYYVSRGTSGNTITFTLFCINEKKKIYISDKIWDINVSSPTANLITFLNFFLKGYYPAANSSVSAYKCDKSFIYVNPSATVAMWINGKKRKIKYGKCCLVDVFDQPWFKPNGIVLRLNDDKNADLIVGKYVYTLNYMSLKSSILYDDIDDYISNDLVPNKWKTGPIPINRKICTIEISLEGKKDIAIQVSTPNPYLCATVHNKKMLNMLTENIMEELSKLIAAITQIFG